jgi:ubiquinone/menaquinone biosynthesis C-methylase UbiE
VGEYNLLSAYPKTIRDIANRKTNQSKYREIAKQYGMEYFDGTREQGYGGYHYDGRWIPIAQRIKEHYQLKPGDRVLDIGCAKGFLIKDLLDICPGLEVWGLDISNYAISHSHPDVSKHLICGTADALPFKDNFFQAVLCINVIHNLERNRCIEALREIERVSNNGASYVQIDAYRNEAECDLFLDWVLTAVTFGTPEFWKAIFSEANYSGDYYWTILESEPS